MLTPNRRLGRAVTAAFDARQAATGTGAWLTPRILPVEQWYRDLWRTAVLRGLLPASQLFDTAGQRQLWRRIIEEDDREFSLLGPGQTAQQCQQARATLRLWQVDWTHPDVAREFAFAEDSAAFLRWLRDFDAHCRDAGLLCPEDAARALLDLPQLLSTQRLLLLDIDPLPPLQQALIERSADLRVFDSGEVDGQRDEVLAFPDARSELRAISRWCLARHQADPDGRYAVMLRDMHSSRELLETFLRRDFC